MLEAWLSRPFVDGKQQQEGDDQQSSYSPRCEPDSEQLRSTECFRLWCFSVGERCLLHALVMGREISLLRIQEKWELGQH